MQWELVYIVPIILVAIIVIALLVTFTLNVRSRSNARGDAEGPGDDPAASPGLGGDHTPLWDTAEHAGEQSSDGQTITPPDAAYHGATGHPPSHYGATVPEDREATGGLPANGTEPPPEGVAAPDPDKEEPAAESDEAARRNGFTSESQRLRPE